VIQLGKSISTSNAMLETVIGVLKVCAKYRLVSLERIAKLKAISNAIEVRNGYDSQKLGHIPELSAQILFA